MRLIFASLLAAGAGMLPSAQIFAGPPVRLTQHTQPSTPGHTLHGPPASAAVLAPPLAMKTEGVPPILQSLAQDIAPYGDFGATRFVAWHPQEQDMLILRRAGNINQLFLQADPLGKPVQLTKGREPVRGAVFEPRRGEYILFARDNGGDEATQIYRLDPKTQQETLLTPSGELHSVGPWNVAQDKVIITARPLDRTGKREQASMDVYAIDPMQPEARFKLATLAGAGWRVLRWLDLENRLIQIDGATIVGAKMSGTMAEVTVRFDADIVAVTRNGKGDVIAGDPAAAVETHDVWTFSRHTATNDPAWLLVGTDEDA